VDQKTFEGLQELLSFAKASIRPDTSLMVAVSIDRVEAWMGEVEKEIDKMEKYDRCRADVHEGAQCISCGY
jgi:hypothetical protein